MLLCQLNGLNRVIYHLYSSLAKCGLSEKAIWHFLRGIWNNLSFVYSFRKDKGVAMVCVTESSAQSLGITGALDWERICLPSSAWNKQLSGTFSTLLPSLSLQSLVLCKLSHFLPSSSNLLIWAVPLSSGPAFYNLYIIKSTVSFVTNAGSWFTSCSGQGILTLIYMPFKAIFCNFQALQKQNHTPGPRERLYDSWLISLLFVLNS